MDFRISKRDSIRAADLDLERLRWFWTLDMRLSFVTVMVGAPVWEYEFFNALKISGFFEESFDYQLRETILIGLFCQGIKMVVEKKRYCELEIYPSYSESIKGFAGELMGVNITKETVEKP